MKKIGTPLEEPEVAKAATPSDAATAPSDAKTATSKATSNGEPPVIRPLRAALKRIMDFAHPQLVVASWMVLDTFLVALFLLADSAVETFRKHLHVDSTAEDVAKILAAAFHVFIVLAVVTLLCFDFVAFAKSLYERNKRR